MPTAFSRGPWTPQALHGGPVAALLARAMEGAAPADAPDMHTAHVTVELLRPVPVAPLAVAANVARSGRKVQILDAHVLAGTQMVAHARAVRIRTAHAREPFQVPSDGEALPSGPLFAGPADSVASPSLHDAYPAFHNAGAELRFARGRFDVPGPSAVWIRLAVPVVPDEDPTPLQRIVAAADFGNGVSAVLPFDRYSYINPDLTVFAARPVVGEWIGLDSHTSLGAPGVGLAHSVLWDEHAGDAGPVGHAIQTLVVEPR